MYFQIVDTNQKCKKAFLNSDLVDYVKDDRYNKTWKHTTHLSERQDVDYGYLLCKGDLDIACPRNLLSCWDKSRNAISSVLKSVHNAQCDLSNSCIYDYIPHGMLMEFLQIKEDIIKNAFDQFEKPKHYDILKKAHILVEEINFDYKIFNGEYKKTNYNVFGTKTGRLSNAKSQIPILNLKKEQRTLLEPTNDLFVEFDYNASELRTLLALSGKPQPDKDMHEWNLENLMDSKLTREEVKKKTFAWLYNPEASDSALESIYDRNTIKDKYRTLNGVKTPFFREIETDDRRSLNYIVQSTSSDVCLEQAYKLREFFKNCKTKICYLLHDSVILDYSREDESLFLQAREIFAGTRFGRYRVNSSIGKNFGEMKSV